MTHQRFPDFDRDLLTNIRDYGGDRGLNPAELKSFANTITKRANLLRDLRVLEAEGAIHNVGTDLRPRYSARPPVDIDRQLAGEVLAVLIGSPNPLTPRQIRDRLDLASASRVFRAVKALEA